MSRLRICFVAPAAYPVLAGARDIAFVGGAEVQQSFIAAELARRGHDVSMICMDHGQREGDRVNGVRLINMHAPAAGIPVVRFLHPRLTSLWGAMRRADAHIYYQRAAGPATGFVASFARLHGRHSVYAAAHDLDFDAAVPQVRYARDKLLFRYGMRHVDKVVVQSEHQVQACLRTFGRSATRVPSCYALNGAPARQDGPIIWVGTVKPIKRPELLLEVAQRLPQYRFRMIGGAAAGPVHFDAIAQRARSIGNVEMVGFVPYADVDAQFDGASILLNTSDGEGFPNTFLQAWSRAMPTVSFFDAQARCDGESVGVTVADLEAMVDAVHALKSDPELWATRGKTAARQFRRHHTVGSVVDAYESIFQDLVPGTREARAS